MQSRLVKYMIFTLGKRIELDILISFFYDTDPYLYQPMSQHNDRTGRGPFFKKGEAGGRSLRWCHVAGSGRFKSKMKMIYRLPKMVIVRDYIYITLTATQNILISIGAIDPIGGRFCIGELNYNNYLWYNSRAFFAWDKKKDN